MNEMNHSDYLKGFRFEFKHLTILFFILIVFQLVLSLIQKSHLKSFLINTQLHYQQQSAESIADLTTTSLELLLENKDIIAIDTKRETRRMVQSFDIIFGQQLLRQNVEEVCVFLEATNKAVAIDEGQNLYYFLVGNFDSVITADSEHLESLSKYYELRDSLKNREQIISTVTEEKTFHIYVPFIMNGKYLGAVYMKKRSHFSGLIQEIITSYDEGAIIYSSLILLGLLAMYFISSFTVKERDEAQRLLLKEHEKLIKEQIDHEKELLFTKRIYHAHHKAEKVMGFIKEDLRSLSDKNIDETKYRVSKYSNFISRVIYDMKWFNPPLQTIRNQLFRTNINEVITFLTEHIFMRISSREGAFDIRKNLDENLPVIHINEYIIWEILEPLIQNSIDHSDDESAIINIETKYNPQTMNSMIIISDNGKGIESELLEVGEDGIKKIFNENITTKSGGNANSGYGCYIAHQLAVKYCGWTLNVKNNEDVGCSFILTIPN